MDLSLQCVGCLCRVLGSELARVLVGVSGFVVLSPCGRAPSRALWRGRRSKRPPRTRQEIAVSVSRIFTYDVERTEHTTYSSSSVSCATSGIVMLPLTSFVSPSSLASSSSSSFFSLFTGTLPVNSNCSRTSKMVMTLPFRCDTSTSPSMLNILLTSADVPSSLDAFRPTSSLVKYSCVHALTSLFTQCQLFGLCRAMVGSKRNVG